MKKKRIFLDIDGVLADFGTHFLNYYNIEDKTPPLSWDDERFLKNMHKTEGDVHFWIKVPPLIKPEEIDFEVSGYCTARPISSDITKFWLDKHNFPNAPVYTVSGSKTDILKSLDCDLFLDDGFHNYEELNVNGIETWLMSRSHNLHNNVGKRVNNMSEFNNVAKTRMLILGHKEHGKSTLANIICNFTGLKAEDSSMAAAKIFIYEELKAKYGYNSFEECYTDRRNKRKEWHDLICNYNKDDKAKLAKEIMTHNNIYIGMRSNEEIEECKRINLFDYVIGIIDLNKPLESEESFNIDIYKHSDIILFVNNDLKELEKKVDKLFGKKKY